MVLYCCYVVIMGDENKLMEWDESRKTVDDIYALVIFGRV